MRYGWLFLVLVVIGLLVGWYVVYFSYKRPIYNECHKNDFDKEFFLEKLEVRAPAFSAKKYFMGRMDVLDDYGNKIDEKSFYVDSGEILVNILVGEDESTFVDPRLAIVLIEMKTRGISDPEVGINYPFGFDRDYLTNFSIDEEEVFMRQVIHFKNLILNSEVLNNVILMELVGWDGDEKDFVELFNSVYRYYFDDNAYECG